MFLQALSHRWKWNEWKDGGLKESQKYRAYLCIWFEAGGRSAERLGCLRGFADESLKAQRRSQATLTAVIGAGLSGQSGTLDD